MIPLRRPFPFKGGGTSPPAGWGGRKKDMEMDFQRLEDGRIELFPGGHASDAVLEAMARLSYETAETPAPFYVQPFDVPSDAVDFGSLIGSTGLRMDYLNGRLCSTHVERRGERLLFDAERFRSDRGSPEAFLVLVREHLEQAERSAWE